MAFQGLTRHQRILECATRCPSWSLSVSVTTWFSKYPFIRPQLLILNFYFLRSLKKCHPSVNNYSKPDRWHRHSQEWHRRGPSPQESSFLCVTADMNGESSVSFPSVYQRVLSSILAFTLDTTLLLVPMYITNDSKDCQKLPMEQNHLKQRATVEWEIIITVVRCVLWETPPPSTCIVPSP